MENTGACAAPQILYTVCVCSAHLWVFVVLRFSPQHELAALFSIFTIENRALSSAGFLSLRFLIHEALL